MRSVSCTDSAGVTLLKVGEQLLSKGRTNLQTGAFDTVSLCTRAEITPKSLAGSAIVAYNCIVGCGKSLLGFAARGIGAVWANFRRP